MVRREIVFPSNKTNVYFGAFQKDCGLPENSLYYVQ